MPPLFARAVPIFGVVSLARALASAAHPYGSGGQQIVDQVQLFVGRRSPENPLDPAISVRPLRLFETGLGPF